MGKTKSLKRTSRKHQKVYNMRGCSRTRKHYLGGSPDAPLAYTGKPTFSIPNPNLAYTGKGGSGCGLSKPSGIPINTNAANSAYPNTGAVANGNTIYNDANMQLGGCGGSCSLTPVHVPQMSGGAQMSGGGCGCGLPTMAGGRKRKGGCGPLCAMGFMIGGVKHRSGCKCSKCKKRVMKGGNPGIPYPNGLVGKPFTPGDISGWPGVDGVSGDRNFIANNSYNNDISRQMVDVGGNRPFLKGGRRKQKGGTLSNFIGQDLINLGRQFQFGMGSAYNALAGYASPVNPLPWKDQFPTKTPFNPATI